MNLSPATVHEFCMCSSPGASANVNVFMHVDVSTSQSFTVLSADDVKSCALSWVHAHEYRDPRWAFGISSFFSPVPPSKNAIFLSEATVENNDPLGA